MSERRRLLLVLFLVALVLRCAFVLAWGLSAPVTQWGDDPEYDATARAMALHHVYQNSWFPPGYPLFLSALYAIFGPSLVAVRLLQALLGAATCCLVYLIGRDVAGAAAGRLAGFLLALYPGHVYLTWRLMAETLWIFLVALAVLLAVRLERGLPASQGNLARATALGLALGASVLVKSNLILLPPLLLLWLAGVALARARRPSGVPADLAAAPGAKKEQRARLLVLRGAGKRPGAGSPLLRLVPGRSGRPERAGDLAERAPARVPSHPPGRTGSTTSPRGSGARRWLYSLAPAAVLAASFCAAGLIAPLAYHVSTRGSSAAGAARFWMLPGNSGHTLWWSNNPLADGYFIDPETAPAGRSFIARHGMGALIHDADPFVRDRACRALGFAWVRENPGSFLALTGLKLWNGFGPLPKAALFAHDRLARNIHLLSYGALLPLAAAGLILSFRRWRRWAILYFVLISHAAMTAATYGTPRFTQVVIPYMLILAGQALVEATALAPGLALGARAARGPATLVRMPARYPARSDESPARSDRSPASRSQLAEPEGI